MNELEEQLWEYIDGGGTPAQREEMAKLIATNPLYKATYEDLLQLNADLGTLELDEPSMGFNYKVMQTIAAEAELKPLKASVNKRIILFIGAFFVLMIGAMLVYIMASINWHQTATTPDILPQIKMPAINISFSSNLVRGFIMFDMVLGLYFLDGYLRKKLNNKQTE